MKPKIKKQKLMFVSVLLVLFASFFLFRTVLASSHDMTVKVSIPSGGGIVTSTPTGINCPSDCEQVYAWGTNVELVATPSAGRTFLGWTGICYTPNCTFSLSHPSNTIEERTAKFGYTSHTITVAKAGNGSGTVSGSGFSCGSVCSKEFANGASVALSAVPATGSKFDGWGETATGGGLCTSGGKDGSLSTSSTCNLQVSDSTNKSLGTATARFSLISTGNSNTTAPHSNQPATNNSASTNNETNTPPEPITEVTLSGQSVKDGRIEMSLPADKGIMLKGKTTPNATVKLYIFSEPQTAEVKADDEGYWSYNISGLKPGDHRVEAEVIDPDTNAASARQLLGSFVVTEPLSTSTTNIASAAQPSSGSRAIWIVLSLLSIGLLGIVAFFVLRRRNSAKAKAQHTSLAPAVEPGPEQPHNSTFEKE